MRLLFVTASLEAGGAERQWHRLIAGLLSDGHDARVLTVGPEGPLAGSFRSLGIEVTALGMRNRFDAGRLGRASRGLSRSPELIVSKDTSAMCVAAMAGFLLRAPHVYNDHDSIGYALPGRRERLAGFVTPSLTGVILISDRQRDRWTPRHIHPDRLHVIPNGVDAPEPADRIQVRQSLGLEPEAVAVTLTATLRPEKRAADFVEAVRAARRTNPNVVGVVVGGGEGLAQLRSQIADDQGFRVLGHREDVPAVLQASDVFMLTSSMEVQPLAALEALASGLPVVATDVGDMDRVVRPGRNGWLIPVGDVEALGERINRLAFDAELRADFGHASLALWKQRWQAEAMVRSYESLLKASRWTPAESRRRAR